MKTINVEGLAEYQVEKVQSLVNKLKEENKSSFEVIKLSDGDVIIEPDNNFVVISAKTLEDFKEAYCHFKPKMLDETTLNYTPIKARFTANISNPYAGKRRLSLQFSTELHKTVFISVELEVVQELLKDHIQEMNSRSISDTEYVYFPGMSKQEIARIKVPCLGWRCRTSDIKHFYKGSVTTWDTTILSAIDYLCTFSS